jgi:hypothetical protein
MSNNDIDDLSDIDSISSDSGDERTLPQTYKVSTSMTDNNTKIDRNLDLILGNKIETNIEKFQELVNNKEIVKCLNCGNHILVNDNFNFCQYCSCLMNPIEKKSTQCPYRSCNKKFDYIITKPNYCPFCGRKIFFTKIKNIDIPINEIYYYTHVEPDTFKAKQLAKYYKQNNVQNTMQNTT